MAGEVRAGPVEADDKTQCDRVTAGGKNDRYGRGRCLRRQSCGGGVGYDHRYAAANEIGCERRQPIGLHLRPAVFDRHIMALDIAGFLQALEKRNGEVLEVIISGPGAEIPDYRQRWLLRPRRERPSRCAAQSRDELPPSRKKLTCSDGVADSRRCRELDSTCLCRGDERLDLHGVAKVSQAFDQGFFLLIGGTAIEVIATEVLIHRPVLEHVVDGGKDGGGNGHDGLVGAAPGFDAIELGLQVAVFLFYRRPGALHQRGLEPGSPLAQAIGSTLAGTLVVARTYASP